MCNLADHQIWLGRGERANAKLVCICITFTYGQISSSSCNFGAVICYDAGPWGIYRGDGRVHNMQKVNTIIRWRYTSITQTRHFFSETAQLSRRQGESCYVLWVINFWLLSSILFCFYTYLCKTGIALWSKRNETHWVYADSAGQSVKRGWKVQTQSYWNNCMMFSWSTWSSCVLSLEIKTQKVFVSKKRTPEVEAA